MGYRIYELKGQMPVGVLVEKADTSRTYIYEVQKGKRSPSEEWLQKMAIALNCTVPELYDDYSGNTSPVTYYENSDPGN